MPRYYFDVHNVPPRLDEIGAEPLNDEAAWHEATVFAGELFRDVDGKILPGQDWALDVADQNREPLFSITISTKKLK